MSDVSRSGPWLSRDIVADAQEYLDVDVADYFFGGADRELLAGENYRAWHDFALEPSYLSRPPSSGTETSFSGRRLASPLVIAPVAFQSLLHPTGEPGLAFAAAVAGCSYTISTRSSRRLSAVADAFALGQRIQPEDVEGIDDSHRALLQEFGDDRQGELWLQVYQTRDQNFVAGLMDTGAAHGVRAAALTIDTPYLGPRYRDQVHGFNPHERLMSTLASEDRDGPAFGDGFTMTAIDQSPDLDYPGFVANCEQRGLDPIFKGILSVRDYESLQAMVPPSVVPWISNHGGRQTDGVATTAHSLWRLGEVADGVEMIVDGGISRPVDALIALALGARVVALGRPVMAAYAVGGVVAVIEFLLEFRFQLMGQLGILGYATPMSLDRTCVVPNRSAVNER